MQKVFDMNGNVYQFLTKAMNLAVLNVLVILFSLPILTMGSAISAAYHVIFDEDEHGSAKILRSYLNFFKQHLTKGTILTSVHLFMLFLLSFVIYLTVGTPFQFVSLVLLALGVLLMTTTFMALAYYDRETFYHLKISLALSLKYTGFLCIGFTSYVISFLIPIFLPKLFVFWFFFGLSIPILFNSRIYLMIMKRIEQTTSNKGG